MCVHGGNCLKNYCLLPFESAMKILHLGKFYPLKGGMEKAILDIVRGISMQGVTCDLLCVSTEKAGVFPLNEHAHIYAMPSVCNVNSVRISPLLIPTLRKLCPNYDIIHIHCPNPMANLALYLSGYRGKVVLHWHSDILKQKYALKLYKPLQTWLIRRADVIIGTSPVYLENSPFLRGMEHKFRIVPLGGEAIVPSADRVSDIRKQYKGKRIIFALGRLIAYKGFRFLIEAARYLDDGYVVLIGGTGPLYNKLLKQINEENLQGKVCLLGYVTDDEVAQYYGACDVFCLSSVWKTEAFGLVQIEAMSCGKPVVATNIEGSGVPWVNRNGYSGLNVEPENPEALAKAIMKITSSEEAYRTYSRQARAHYNKMFVKERMLAGYEQVYASLYHEK